MRRRYLLALAAVVLLAPELQARFHLGLVRAVKKRVAELDEKVYEFRHPKTDFRLSSPVGADGESMAAEYTCDGAGNSPALSWSGAPAGTREFALLMTTLPGDGTTKWNWLLYGIPASATGLPKNTSGVGTLGVNSDTQSQVYAPPCSQGPGLKVYTYTLYALSASPTLPAAGQVTGDVLTQAIASLTLGKTSFNLGYSRGSAVGAFNFMPGAPTPYNTISFIDSSQNNPVSWAWDFGDGATSTEQFPTHAYGATGNYTVTLRVANSISSTQISRTVAVTIPSYNNDQAVSDTAQSTTLAFDALGIMNANLGAMSYFPPGKVADYTGFQYLRDVDPSDMGHNPLFTGLASNSVVRILTDAQLSKLAALAVSQADLVNRYAYDRFKLIRAFRRLLDGGMPAGATGLSLSSVTVISQDLYRMDGQIAFDRALLYSDIYKSMTRAQKAGLEAMKGVGASSWAVTDDATMKDRIRTALGAHANDKTMNTLVMTYAGDIFSWYSGSVLADVYFCPERHGTYYGGFYIKDAPAMNAPPDVSYTIDATITGNAGAALIDSSKGYVTSTQAAVMANLINVQRSNMDGILQVRTQVATLLRGLQATGASSETIKAQVLALSYGTYGRLDGENNYFYVNTFNKVSGMLTAAQKSRLKTELWDGLLKDTYTNGVPYDYSVCRSTYLYSDPVTDAPTLAQIGQYINDTDGMFSANLSSASFVVSPSQPAPNEAASFMDTSTDMPTSWSWSFGDGGTSTAQYPVHTYTTAGDYTVTLTVHNVVGDSTFSRRVTVATASPPPPPPH